MAVVRCVGRALPASGSALGAEAPLTAAVAFARAPPSPTGSGSLNVTDISVSPDPIETGGDGVFTIHGTNTAGK